jgi:hypothetical protein
MYQIMYQIMYQTCFMYIPIALTIASRPSPLSFQNRPLQSLHNPSVALEGSLKVPLGRLPLPWVPLVSPLGMQPRCMVQFRCAFFGLAPTLPKPGRVWLSVKPPTRCQYSRSQIE